MHKTKKLMMILALMISHSAVSLAAEVSASIGGAIRGGGIHGHHTYVAQRDSIYVLDTSDRDEFRIVGRFSEQGEQIDRAALRWPIMFYSCHQNGSVYSSLGCLDVTSPTTPLKVGLIGPHGGKCIDFATSGTMLFVRDRVYDISNPQEPKVIEADDLLWRNYKQIVEANIASAKRIKLPPDALYSGSVQNVRVIGNVAYVIDEAPGLKMIDITDLANPKYVGASKDSDKIKSQMRPKTVIKESGVLYGKYRIRPKDIDESDGDEDYNHSIVIEDGSKTNEPKTVATIRRWFGSGKGTDSVVEAWVSDDNLILVCSRANTGGNHEYLEVYSLKNPHKPLLAGTVSEIDEPPNQVFVSGNIAYIAAGENGLIIRSIVPGKLKWDDQ